MTALYGMRSLKEVRDMLLFAHSSEMKILSMTKIFLMLYDLNKSSQNSRPFSLILKNRRICDCSQIFVNTFILKSMETSGNKTTSVFLMYNNLTYVDDLVFVSR